MATIDRVLLDLSCRSLCQRRRGPTRPKTATPRLLLVGLALLAAGCTFINAYEDPAVVGDWEGRVPALGEERDTLRAKLDGSGRASLFYHLAGDGAVHQAKFKTTWEQIDEQEFEIDLRCTSSSRQGEFCAEDNFRMECKAKSEGERLGCEITRPPASNWATVTFDLRRD